MGVVVVVMAIAIGMIAVAVRPEEDSIAYHRKKYSAAYHGWVWDQELVTKARKVLGQQQRWHTDTKRMEHHERALIRLGYLDERTVIVTNCPPEKVRAAVYKAAANWRKGVGSLRVEIQKNNRLKIVATKRDVPGLEEAARNADALESAK